MKKLLLVGILLALVAGGAFGQNWAKSYNKDNQINVTATLGYYYALLLNPGVEWVPFEFKIGPVPLDFGVMVKGSLGFILDSAMGSGFGWRVAPLAALHLGLKDIPLEFFVSAGICIGGAGGAVGVDFATVGGAIYHLSDMFGILLESGYVGGFYWGAGVEIQF